MCAFHVHVVVMRNVAHTRRAARHQLVVCDLRHDVNARSSRNTRLSFTTLLEPSPSCQKTETRPGAHARLTGEEKRAGPLPGTSIQSTLTWSAGAACGGVVVAAPASLTSGGRFGRQLPGAPPGFHGGSPFPRRHPPAGTRLNVFALTGNASAPRGTSGSRRDVGSCHARAAPLNAAARRPRSPRRPRRRRPHVSRLGRGWRQRQRQRGSTRSWMTRRPGGRLCRLAAHGGDQGWSGKLGIHVFCACTACWCLPPSTLPQISPPLLCDDASTSFGRWHPPSGFSPWLPVPAAPSAGRAAPAAASRACRGGGRSSGPRKARFASDGVQRCRAPR